MAGCGWVLGELGLFWPCTGESIEGSLGHETLQSLLFLLLVFLAVFEICDAHLSPFLELGNGKAEVVFVLQAFVEFFEIVVVHHPCEWFGLV